RWMGSGTRVPALSRLSVQYVSRNANAVLNVRYGHFVNGNRMPGNRSTRARPRSLTRLFFLSVRMRLAHSLGNPKEVRRAPVRVFPPLEGSRAGGPRAFRPPLLACGRVSVRLCCSPVAV